MIVKDARSPRGRIEEYPGRPSTGAGLAGVTSGFSLAPDSPLAQGRCPLCGIKMNNGNQRSCVRLPNNSWKAMRRTGRGGYRFGAGRMVA